MKKTVTITVEEYKKYRKLQKADAAFTSQVAMLKLQMDQLRNLFVKRQEEPESSELTEKETRIFEYIKQNSGTSKQAVVDSFKGKYSRVVVFNTMKSLEQSRMINAKKDESNRQTYNLFIENDSLLSSLSQDLDSLVDDFRESLRKIKDEFGGFHDSGGQGKWQKKKKKSSNHDVLSVLCNLFVLYQYVFRIYTVQGLVIWSKKTSDRRILNRLRRTLFVGLSDVQIEFLDAFHDISVKHRLLEKLISDLLVPQSLRQLLFQSLKEYNINKEVMSIIKIADDRGNSLLSLARADKLNEQT